MSILRTLAQPFARRRALKALAAYSAVKDAYRRAVVRGDTREQGRLQPILNAAMIDRLKAEKALVSFRPSASIPTARTATTNAQRVAS